jgi:leucyl aminopeptidase (aminopeptidase T)
MNVQENDRVLVISDQKTRQIGSALLKESQQVSAAALMIMLEDIGSRPMTEVPDKLLKHVDDFLPTVTFYAADSLEGEVKMRMALTQEIRKIFTTHDQPLPRHGHMVGVTPRLIREGMTADYQEINRLTMKVLECVKDAKTIHVTSKKGTDINASFNPNYHWVPCHGLYHQAGDWGNLPEGEVFTCPWELSGKLVVDVLGDFFSIKYGVLDHPVSIIVKDSLVQDVTCQDQSIADELLDYLDSAENGRRAGEFAIGTNTSVKKLSGNLLQDEKIPGIHVAFGNPSGYQTGADWHSEVHVDVVPTNCTITVDDRTIMVDGQFLPGILE